MDLVSVQKIDKTAKNLATRFNQRGYGALAEIVKVANDKKRTLVGLARAADDGTQWLVYSNNGYSLSGECLSKGSLLFGEKNFVMYLKTLESS